jgi:hypothetical protein
MATILMISSYPRRIHVPGDSSPLIPGTALRRLAGQFMKVFLSHSTKTGAFVVGTAITNQPDDLGGGPVGFLSIN